MSAGPAHHRRRRLISMSAAGLVAVSGLVAFAPTAEAAPAPRTYTASFTQPSAPVAHGVSSDYVLSVKNTSTSISALDRIRITIPTGFSVVPGTVTAPRNRWSESISGQILTAKTSTPVLAGLRRGETLTVGFKATAPLGCAAAVAQWPLSVDGILLVFSTTGPTPSVNVAAVAGPCASAVGTPNVPLGLSVDGGEAGLPNGASGPVSLVVQPCSSDEETCENGSEIVLTGNFKSGQTPLYSFESPASITRICSNADCPHQYPGGEGVEPEAGETYDYNLSCAECGDEREMEEDFAWYPTYVSLLAGGNYLPFGEAPRCAPVGDVETFGQLATEQAQAVGYCVDVNRITREGNSFTGDLRIPVLFVEDPRVRP